MRKILFEGENLTAKESYKMLEQFTGHLEVNEEESFENDNYTYAEYPVNEETKIKVAVTYKNNNYDVDKMIITESTEVLPDAGDFNKIETLRDKYITNWDSIPEQLQKFIMSCNSYWISLQEVILYQDRQAVASLGVSRWYSDVEVISAGAYDLFQWNNQEGFTKNNLRIEEVKELLKGYINNGILENLDKASEVYESMGLGKEEGDDEWIELVNNI